MEEVRETMLIQSPNAESGYAGRGPGHLLREFFACGLLTVDSSGKIVSITAPAERILQQPASSKRAKAPALPPPVLAIVKEVVASGQPVIDRHIVCRPSSETTTPLSVTAMPVTAGPSPKAVAVLLKQLASMERLERHIQRLDRLANIGTLSASLAHEIKNALVPVKTFVDLLLEKNPDAELAGTVRREMSRMDAIICRLLKPAATAKPEFSTVHLHELLEHSLRVVQHRTEAKSIAFESHLKAAPDTVRGNDQLLEQAFLNLLVNAVEAMDRKGSLRVQTQIVTEDARLPQRLAETTPKFLRVQVVDSGPGILPEHVHLVFDAFFTTKQSGTGLGLAVTRGIIEDHGGIIGVESKPGHGTTFTILLPTSA